MIFVGGLQRSGTTLLGRVLAEHADVAGLVGTATNEDEGQFVQDVYPTDHEMGRMSSRHLRGAVNHWAFHPASHLTEADLARLPDAADRLSAAWSPYWSKVGVSWYVEKSPSNLTRMRFLQAAFPGSASIVITRHPITQALAVRKWAHLRARIGIDFPQIIEHWLTAMEQFEEDRSHLKRSLTVKYEELISAPDATFSRVANFVGLPKSAVDLSGISDRDSGYRRYWSAVRGDTKPFVPLNETGSIPRRLVRLVERIAVPTYGRRQVRRMIDEFEPRVRRFGYSFDDLQE